MNTLGCRPCLTGSLTKSVDNLVGDGGNNTFIAGDDGGNASLSAGDTINGGAGIDTLKIFNATNAISTANFANATITNVENVEATLNVVGQTFNVSTNADVQKVTLVNGTGGTVTAGLKQQVGVTGTVSSATAFTFQNATGLADSATLNLNGANTAAGGLTVAAIETLNIAATGANVLGAVTAAAAEKLVITGAGSVSATLASTVTKTIDASAATGNLTINNAAAAEAVQSIKTGSGNDTYTTQFAHLAKDDVIDLGAGTDSLRFSDDATFTTDAQKAQLTGVAGVEQLGTVDAALTVDGNFVSQTSFYTDGTAGKFVGTNLANATALTFGAGAELASTAAMKLGANNALTVNLAGSETAASNAVAGLTVTGSTTVTVNSTGTVGVADNVLKLTAADNQSVVVTGAHNLTLTTANASNVTGFTIDGSAFTGKLTVTGTAAADIIKGGSGDDIIGGGAGADTLTGGAGKDKFVIVAGNTAATADTITDFVTKVDTITFGAAVVAADVTKGAAVVADFAAALAAANLVLTHTGGAATTQINLQQVGSDTYAFYNDAVLKGADQVVKLSGVALAGVDAADFVAA